MAYYNNQMYGFPYSQPVPDQLSQLRYGQMQQPMMSQAQMQQPTEASPIIWVQGEAGAKAHMVAPGNSAVLWDSENPLIYIKSADAAGMPSMRIIEWKERGSTSPISMAQNTQYVTIDEYNKLVGVVNDLAARLNGVGAKEGANEQ